MTVAVRVDRSADRDISVLWRRAHLGDIEDGHRSAFQVGEDEERVCSSFYHAGRNGERHWNGPIGAVGEPAGLREAGQVRCAEEAGERRIAA